MCSTNFFRLHSTAAKGHTKVVDLLLDAVDPDDVRDKHGNTPLILASANGYAETVGELLAHTPNPAIVFGFDHIVELLIENSPSIAAVYVVD